MNIESTVAARPTSSEMRAPQHHEGQDAAAGVVGAERELERRRLERLAGRLRDVEHRAREQQRREDGDQRRRTTRIGQRRACRCGCARTREEAGSKPCADARRCRARTSGPARPGPPAAPSRSARSCAHPRVELAVEQVGHEVGEDHGRRRTAGTAPAAAGTSGPAERVDGERAEAVDREHVLDRDRAADDEAEVEEDQGHRGQHARWGPRDAGGPSCP